MITLLITLASSILPSLLGLAERQFDKRRAAMNEQQARRHRERLAELNYRAGRNEQIRAIQGDDKTWSPMNIIRFGFAAPFVVMVNFLVWHWMLIGAWYPIGDMPEIIQYTMLSVLNFALLAEGVNAHGNQNIRQKILSDPEYAKSIQQAGAVRAEAFQKRTGHGPKGQ